MGVVSIPWASLTIIKRNEWAEVQSVNRESRIIQTNEVGSDFVTILINRERKWAIMVRTGLDTDVTNTFRQVLQRAKELNNQSFAGIAVKTIGGQPRYSLYCHTGMPLDKIYEITKGEISNDNLRIFPGQDGRVYECVQVDALDGKTKLGASCAAFMECTPISTRETVGIKGYITAEKVPEKLVKEEYLDGDYVMV